MKQAINEPVAVITGASFGIRRAARSAAASLDRAAEIGEARGTALVIVSVA